MPIGRPIRGMLRRAHREERGQVLVFFAMFIVTVGLAMGVVAVDASFWHSERRHVQAAADAAALAAAQDIPSADPTVIAKTAEKYAAFDGYENGKAGVTVETHWPPQNGPHAGQREYVEVIIHSPTAGFFIGAFKGLTAPSHGALAEAGWDIGRANGTSARSAECGLYVLDPHNIETLFVDGAGSLRVTNSCLEVTSDNGGEAAEIEGPGDIRTGVGSGGTRVVGRCVIAGGGGRGSFQPPCTHPTVGAQDPLSGAPTPTNVDLPGGLPTGCSGAPIVCNLSGPASLNAGVYKTINVRSGTVTLNAGIYVITGTLGGDGAIQSSGGVVVYFGCAAGAPTYYRACSSVDGTGVMGSLTLTNNGRLTIQAPTKANCAANDTCDYVGMALFYDSRNKDDLKLQDDSTLSVTGTIYAPAARFLHASEEDSSVQSLVIVNKIVLSEDGSLGITYDPAQNYSLPGAVLTE